MTLDLSASPGAATAWRRIGKHAATEALLIARNGEQVLLALVIPMAILIVGHTFGHRFGLGMPALAPSVLCLAIWSTMFTSLAISTAFERRAGVLERLAATPLGRSGLLAGKALALMAICGVQVLILAATALALGWRPRLEPVSTAVAVAVVILSGFALANLGLILAGRLRAEAVLALANIVYVLAAVLGAVIIPLAEYPAWSHPLVASLPTAALGETLRCWSSGRPAWWALPVSVAWAIVSALVARKVFRWMS